MASKLRRGSALRRQANNLQHLKSQQKSPNYHQKLSLQDSKKCVKHQDSDFLRISTVIHKFSKQIITKGNIANEKEKVVTNQVVEVKKENQPATSKKPDQINYNKSSNLLIKDGPVISTKGNVNKKRNGSLDFYEECDVRGNQSTLEPKIILESKESRGKILSRSTIKATGKAANEVNALGNILSTCKLHGIARSNINKYSIGIVASQSRQNLLFNISSQRLKRIQNDPIKVYTFRDVYTGRRVLMKNLGIDVGTKTIVVAFRNGDKTEYISEINGYYPFERCTPFIKNMLNDPNKVRSDGTSRPARWFELDGKAIVLGRDAEEFAYSKNDTLLRPMAEGGIAADEEAMTVLAAIVQGLISMAEKEIGKFEDQVKLCYCTTAPAINKESNIDYHKRVVNLVIEGYESEAKLSHENIKESHAIVIDMSTDGTGIGISWGAGTVTVSYVKYGLEVYSFCWVGAGDWISDAVVGDEINVMIDVEVNTQKN